MAWSVLIFLGACQLTPQEEARDVCSAYCRCLVVDLPVEQTQCIEQQCLPALPPVTQSCMNCVFENDRTCTALTKTCDSLCLQQNLPGAP